MMAEETGKNPLLVLYPVVVRAGGPRNPRSKKGFHLNQPH
jgi:hypothetical protein